MKFKYIAEVTEPTKTYDGHMCVTGDIIDLDGYVALKAAKDPTLQAVDETASPKSAKKSAKAE